MIGREQPLDIRGGSRTGNQCCRVTFLQGSSFVDSNSKCSTPSFQNILILEFKEVEIGTSRADGENMLVIWDLLRVDRGYDGIGDVYELGHDALTAHVRGLVHRLGVPERQNRPIELSKEFVPFLIGGRFFIYYNKLALSRRRSP